MLEALPRATQYLRTIGKVVVGALAFIGGVCVLGALLLAGVANDLIETQVVRAVSSPDKRSVAEIEVRKGGLGTVWTTRVHLRTDTATWTVYQAKDSNFEPPLSWADSETLVIGLPCDRFDYVSNPDDWERSDPAERRLKVRLRYPDSCGGTR
jgi:hypothetical protein